jgi:hypothetical protein
MCVVAWLLALAFALDKARNNESVVALLIYQDQYLLFPGDAQYGNWRGWLEQDDAQDILGRIRFLKVAHHGSVNATPNSALEQMTEGMFATMVSTQSVPWKSIPRVPLMARLSERATKRVVRSDWIPVPDAPVPASGAQPPMPRLTSGLRSRPTVLRPLCLDGDGFQTKAAHRFQGFP